MGGRPVNIVEGVAYGLPVTESEFGEPMTPTDGPGEPVIIVDDGGIPVKFINDDMSDYSPVTGITPAMAMLTAYSRTLTDEVAAYEATYTGASQKTMTDQYGLQTFGPNNKLTYWNDQTNAAWISVNTTETADQGADEYGANTLDLITTTAANGKLQYNVTVEANDMLAFLLRPGTGTTVVVDNGAAGAGDVTDFVLSGSGSYTVRTNNASAGIEHLGGGLYYCWVKRGATAGNRISFSTATSGHTFYMGKVSLSRVTHETLPRVQDRVATTSAAFYGPRFVYAPETLQTSSTSITIGSGSTYTFGVADESLYSIGDVVQGTNNSDPDAWVRGYVTGTSTGFVTIGTYTFPGTAYSRPVLTNGSGTISDWSVIRSDGYLAEPAATNINTYSDTNSAAIYVDGGGTATVTENDVAGISGLTTADKWDVTTSALRYKDVGVLTAAAYTLSRIVKVGTATTFKFGLASSGYNGVTFNLSTKAVSSADTGFSGTVKDLGGGFLWLTITVTASAATYYSTLSLSNGTIWLDACWIELGSVATSYIPTAASSVARSADVDSLSTAGWWTGSGTFVAAAKTPCVGDLTIFKLSDGTANEVIDFYTSGTNPVLQITDGGAAQLAPLDLGTAVADTSSRYAIRIAANDVNGAQDGTAVTADNSVTLPTVTTLSIGEHGGLSELLYFAPEEVDSSLEALSA